MINLETKHGDTKLSDRTSVNLVREGHFKGDIVSAVVGCYEQGSTNYLEISDSEASGEGLRWRRYQYADAEKKQLRASIARCQMF